MEDGDEGVLFVGLDRLLAVRSADPCDSLVRGCSGQHSEARQGGARAAVPSEATHLDALAASRAVQHVLERDAQLVGIGHTEVDPREMGMVPWRRPARIEVEPERWRLVALVRVVNEEPGADDRGAVGEGHLVAVSVGSHDGPAASHSAPDGEEKLICHRGILVPAHSFGHELSSGGLHGEDRPDDSGAIVADHPVSHVRQGDSWTTFRDDASPVDG